MEAIFQQNSSWVADFIFRPVVMPVFEELWRSGVVHVLHNWFSLLGTITLSARCSREL